MKRYQLIIIGLVIYLGMSTGIGFAQVPPDLGDLNDKAKSLARPEYPFAALYNRVGGIIKVKITVNEKGDVVAAEAVSGEPALREASVAAALKSKFDPYLVRSQAVKFTGILTFTFQPLSDAELKNLSVDKMPAEDKALWQKQFTLLSADFNTQNKVYAEKVNAVIDALKNRDKDMKSYCKALVELDDNTSPLETTIDKLDKMYHSGNLKSFVNAQDLEVVRQIVEVLKYEIFKRKLSVAADINAFRCREQPEKKVTLDNLVEASKIQTRNRIIEILKNLGNMEGYFAAGKRFNALTGGSTQTEVCEATLAFKKESDRIEPALEEFAKIYVLEVPAEYADPDKPARTVDFPEPELTNRAEKTLLFRTKVVLPEKSEIKRIGDKYHCR